MGIPAEGGPADEPEVSWRLVRRGTPVIGREGTRLGRVTRLLGDPNRDIFDGIAFRAGIFAPEHVAELPAIARITERGIFVLLSEAEAGPAAPASALARSWAPSSRRRRREDDD